MAANGPPCSDAVGVSCGTDSAARRFPGRHDAHRSLPRSRLCARARRLRAGQLAIRRQFRGERRADRAERSRRWSGQRLHRLPRPARRGRRRVRGPSRGTRRRLSRTTADRLCRWPTGRSANELYRGQAEGGRTPRGCRVLCGARCAATGRNGRSAVRGGAALSRWRRIARLAVLRLVPRGARRRHRLRQSSARRPAGRLPRRTAGAMAPFEPQERSGRRDAADQPASQSVRNRGSRGSCGCPSRGSSQSGTSGSIPRSTS